MKRRKKRRRKWTAIYAVLTAILVAISGYIYWLTTRTKEPLVIDGSTPPEVVEKMLAMAWVSSSDVVYDLGCGDGRVLIAAAKKFGCRGVGVEQRPQAVELARRKVAEAGVGNLVEIRQGEFLTTDFTDATVLVVSPFPELNVPLVPRLNRLRPGSRVVSYTFSTTGVNPWEKSAGKTKSQERKICLWVPPIPKSERKPLSSAE